MDPQDSPIQPPRPRKRPHPSSHKAKVTLFHSKSYAELLHASMKSIHQDRDLLLDALLYVSGFVKNLPPFLQLQDPMHYTASRNELEQFHNKQYLDWIQFPPISTGGGQNDSNENDLASILESHGLCDDCPIGSPTLYKYLTTLSGTSIAAARLLRSSPSMQVAIHWGGGRHHAHKDSASGFCYINDVVLAIQTLQFNSDSNGKDMKKRVLYLDLDIHHADGVQEAFYDTDSVLTISLHRHTPGFFPASSGSTQERGKFGTDGVGYNLNLQLPCDIRR